MKRGFGLIAGLALMLSSSGAWAANGVTVWDSVTAITANSTSSASTSGYSFGFVGLTTLGESRSAGALVNTESGWATPEEYDGWRRTINKCSQFAQRVFNKPKKFDLRVEVIGADFASDNGSLSMTVNGAPAGSSFESLICTLQSP